MPTFHHSFSVCLVLSRSVLIAFATLWANYSWNLFWRLKAAHTTTAKNRKPSKLITQHRTSRTSWHFLMWIINYKENVQKHWVSQETNREKKLRKSFARSSVLFGLAAKLELSRKCSTHFSLHFTAIFRHFRVFQIAFLGFIFLLFRALGIWNYISSKNRRKKVRKLCLLCVRRGEGRIRECLSTVYYYSWTMRIVWSLVSHHSSQSSSHINQLRCQQK